jgi:hypothetical protein
MIETIRKPGIGNQWSHIRRDIAGKRAEIAKTRMDESRVAPELEPVDRTHGGGELDTFACDFAGDGRLRRAYRDEHITLDDIVKGDGPFRFVVPEKLFSACFVYPRTCQPQRGPWRDGKNGSYSGMYAVAYIL